MKLVLIVVFYALLVLGFLFTALQLFKMGHITPAWFSLIFAFLSIPSIKS